MIFNIQNLGSRAPESRRASPYFLSIAQTVDGEIRLSQLAQLRGMHPDLIRRMIDNVSFISDHFRAMKKEDRVTFFYYLK